MKLNFCVFGAGRIGAKHIANVAAHEGAELRRIVDPDLGRAQSLAEKHGAIAGSSANEALADPGVDAVVIASSTETHTGLLTAAAKAGKAILCEKPIDLDLAKVAECEKALEANPVPVMIGFQRRFDPTHKEVKRIVDAGAIGKTEVISIVSRDPAPPPAAYIAVSGGQFIDQMIHDFDLALWMSDEAGPTEVFAMGGNLVDPEIGRLGDTDTAQVLLRFRSGAFCRIDCNRRSAYGYDQRVEVFGSQGLASSGNVRDDSAEIWTSEGTEAKSLVKYDFLARYLPSYAAELDVFIECVREGRPVQPDFASGRRAQQLAEAAGRSHRSGKLVTVDLD